MGVREADVLGVSGINAVEVSDCDSEGETDADIDALSERAGESEAGAGDN